MASNSTSSSASATVSSSASVSVSTETSSIPTTIVSTSLTTETSTTILTSASSTITSTSIETSSVVTSIITQSPSTVVVTTTPRIEPSTSIVGVTSYITETPTVAGSTLPPTTVVYTSTQPNVIPSTLSTSTSSSSSTTSSASALPAGSSSSSSSGLSTGATVAIGVIIPVVVIAALILFGLWFWRRRKARKADQEQRKNEMAEYSFNPNHDQTLVPGAAAYVDGDSDPGGEGYRGWGTTSSARKASTTLGSNGRPANGVVSETGSQPGGYQAPVSPVTGNGSEAYSGDALMPHPSHEAEAVGALGGAGVAAGYAGGLARHSSSHEPGVRRGPSNASSAYTTGGRDVSEESDRPEMPAPYYHEEVPYNIYNEQASHGPYGDGTYGGGPSSALPIVRDVQARRNTQIQRVPTFPQQAGGIAQNF